MADVCKSHPGYTSIYDGVLLHFDPFAFINPDKAAALTPDLASVTDTIILDYPSFPAVQHTSLPHLKILEYLALACGTFYRQYHLYAFTNPGLLTLSYFSDWLKRK